MSQLKFGDKVTVNGKKAIFRKDLGTEYVVMFADSIHEFVSIGETTPGWPREPEVWEGVADVGRGAYSSFLQLPDGEWLTAKRYKVRAEEVME